MESGSKEDDYGSRPTSTLFTVTDATITSKRTSKDHLSTTTITINATNTQFVLGTRNSNGTSSTSIVNVTSAKHEGVVIDGEGCKYRNKVGIEF